MYKNTLKQKLARGIKSTGCFLLLPNPDVSEILAHIGFDVLLIDHEHGPGSYSDAIAQMRAMQATDVASMVRVPANDPVAVKRILDCGARNILCPNVETAEQADAFVRACRYPPRGVRGAGGGIRAAHYGLNPDYYEKPTEDEILIALQIESPGAVAEIDKIAAVPGVDMLLIGPRDLSAAMGVLNRFDDPELLAMLKRAEERILASGKYLASVVYPGTTARQMFSRGYGLLIVGTDVGFISQGAKSALAEARK